ncbi:MAG: hypothetical protein HUJ73_00220, partial [Eubacterium sp.]|nr:hypothetical protein [Eubacterium sp.]
MKTKSRIVLSGIIAVLLLVECGCTVWGEALFAKPEVNKANRGAGIVFTDANQEAEEESLQNAAEQQSITDEQRNSINMLNYLTVLVQEINSSTNSRLFLEGAYSDLINNTEPSIVDDLTLDEYENILDIIEKYRMIAVKRERLKYIYDQNCANAIREAMPSPLSILNIVQSGNPLKALVSVAFAALDSANSYQSHMNELDMQYLQDGWALDDEEAANLHSSRSSMFSYMVRVARDLPKGITLNEEAVQEFVDRINETNVNSRIQWLESNKKTYENYGEYWLVLADSYYEKAEAGDTGCYQKCLDAVSAYEKIDNSIFRKDTRFAQTLPCAISSAKTVLSPDEYVETASRYAQLIVDNTNNDDWSLRYFAAQTFIDLYSVTDNKDYLQKAYNIVRDNVNELVGEQRLQNETYLNDLVLEPTEDLDKDKKKEVEQYNKLLKKERETELAPVYEPLRLNCELLVGLADKLNISPDELKNLDGILHEDGEALFLNPIIDNQYRLVSEKEEVSSDL